MTIRFWEWEQHLSCAKQGSEGSHPQTDLGGQRGAGTGGLSLPPQHGESLNLCLEVSSTERCSHGPVCADSAVLAMHGQHQRRGHAEPSCVCGCELHCECVFVLRPLKRNIWRYCPKGYEPSGNLTNAIKSLRSSKISRWGKKRGVQKNLTGCVLQLEALSGTNIAPGSITEVSRATASHCISFLPRLPPSAAALPWQPRRRIASSRPILTISLGKF